MAVRFSALLPRLTALTLIWLLATSTVTFAAGGRSAPPAASAPVAKPKGPETLVVPDVRGQAYVFAKGILEQGGFAWRVEGRVRGYAANAVTVQTPGPGTKVVDNGAPTITLRLERNAAYAERGLPEDESQYAGTKAVLVSDAVAASKPTAPREAPTASSAPKKVETPKAKKSAKARGPRVARSAPFTVPGAPREPRDEMPLPQRAKLLERRLAGQSVATPTLVRYWLYQHSWIVTGAKFGWSGGEEALRTLIAIDRDLQARWNMGAASEKVARAALAEVERRSRR